VDISEFAILVARGSRLAARNVGEFAYGAVRGEHLTMRGHGVCEARRLYPRPAEATLSERDNWRLIGSGEGVHWPDLDEDIPVDAVVRGEPSGEAPASLQRWRWARGRDHG
jgi:hypothetical protein